MQLEHMVHDLKTSEAWCDFMNDGGLYHLSHYIHSAYGLTYEEKALVINTALGATVISPKLEEV